MNKSYYLRPLALLILIGFGFNSKIYAQSGFLGVPTIEYYDREDYQSHIMNEEITQDDRGLLYVANKWSLMEYDGSNWKRHFAIQGERGITSLYYDPSGRIYASSREIGYYYPDKRGKYEFHKLNHLLPDGHRVHTILNTLPYKGGHVFSNFEHLYFYDGDTITFTKINPPHSLFIQVCNDELYFNPDGKGLSIYTDGNWELIPGGDELAEMYVVQLLPYADNSMIAFTENNGIYVLEEGEVQPFAPSLKQQLGLSRVQDVIQLSDGNYALGTRNDGLFIINQEGDLVYHFDGTKGLNTSEIRDVFQDSFGNIWLARENGLAKIHWNSAFSYIREEIDLPGVGICALSDGDEIYFGTSTGLYKANKSWPISGIERVNNIRDAVYNIQNINGQIFASGYYNSFYKEGDGWVTITPDFGFMNYGFKETKDPNILIRGNVDGMYRVEKVDGVWQTTKKYKDFIEWTKYFEFDDQGRLWTTSSIKGVFQFTFSEDYQTVTSKKVYGLDKGLPSIFAAKVFKVNNELIYSTNFNGIYQYSEEEDMFFPSEKWNGNFVKSQHVYEFGEDALGNIYFADIKNLGRLEKNIGNEFARQTSEFDGIQSYIEGRLAVLDDRNVLFSTPKGFVHYNKTSSVSKNYMPNLLIREVKLTRSDSILFGGNFVQNGKVLSSQPESDIPILPFSDNSLVISYSGVDYNQSNKVYRYQLEGFDSGWSSWTPSHEKEYTNLNSGTYSFRVQTKNISDELSSIQTYQFIIAPPWYGTLPMIIIYVLGASGLLFLSFRLYRKKFSREIGELKRVNIETEMQHKKKELATTTMHLVDKTEFISSVKGKLSELLENKGSDTNRKIRSIINQIERNTAEDKNWENFEIHFDEVHRNFIKRILEEYPTITPQEIKLTAFLRMNMSTKEIANLLKISVRAVEMARYRLRRKLDIGKDENLNSFMMNY